MATESARIRWLQSRLWLCLLLYWLISMIGAGVLARAGARTPVEATWIVFIMLVVVIGCMLTERGRWKVWQRVGFVLVSWLMQVILSIPVAFTIGVLVLNSGSPHLADRTIAFLASLPVVIFALRQSSFFVKTVGESAE
mgnify:CR=1 FL=1